MEGLGGIWILLSASHLLFNNKETRVSEHWGMRVAEHSRALWRGAWRRARQAEGCRAWVMGSWVPSDPEAEGFDIAA